MFRSPLALAILAAQFGLAFCHPFFWPGTAEAGVSCSDHPARQYGLHRAPEVDEGITFSLLKGKKKVSKFCPGEEYTVELKFPEPRKAMMTATSGKFTLVEDVDDIPCDFKRKDFLGDPAQGFLVLDSYAAKWTAPCDKNIKEVTLKVTSAAGAVEPYRQGSVTFSKKGGCGKKLPKSCA